MYIYPFDPRVNKYSDIFQCRNEFMRSIFNLINGSSSDWSMEPQMYFFINPTSDCIG